MLGDVTEKALKAMPAIKGMRLPIDVNVVSIRWHAAYPLSHRHVAEMMHERGVFVDHSQHRQHWLRAADAQLIG